MHRIMITSILIRTEEIKIFILLFSNLTDSKEKRAFLQYKVITTFTSPLFHANYLMKFKKSSKLEKQIILIHKKKNNS